MKKALSFCKYITGLTIILFALNGCKPSSSNNGVPTYIHIDSFTLKPGSLPLTSSSAIEAVWVYWNNSPIAIVDLPATVPLLATEPGVLSLGPGINLNGQFNFMVLYPFYKSDAFNITPNPGNVITLNPTTSFLSAVKYKVISNFNGGTSGFKLASGTTEMVIVTDSLKFEGNGSGMIKLRRPNDTLCEDSCTTTFNIPANKDAYIEINYKNTIPFSIGLKSTFQTYSYMRYLTGAFPSATWKKFYISVRDFVGHYPGDTYSLYIKATLPEGVSEGTVLLDNIQLVYFD